MTKIPRRSSQPPPCRRRQHRICKEFAARQPSVKVALVMVRMVRVDSIAVSLFVNYETAMLSRND